MCQVNILTSYTYVEYQILTRSGLSHIYISTSDYNLYISLSKYILLYNYFFPNYVCSVQ